MIRAYSELYLGHARKAFAQMLDRAVYHFGMELKEFYALFLVSSVSVRFQRGDCSVTAGRSGAELAQMVLEETGTGPDMDSAQLGQRENAWAQTGRSREYWTGWALAYYQWYAAVSFRQIDQRVPIETILKMYPRYHEMDVLQFCDVMDERMAADQQEARLRFYRRRLGISQRQLAEAADIPVRTIQQYEQRQKNINKAQAEYLLRLSQVLRCAEADLMELQSSRR
ncbi:MAG: helix-turn-helix transcriptional regulator [Firmicutes bacterium]|nr:helix-turn-helix transcriptional regulator [Bacillota bacterium]